MNQADLYSLIIRNVIEASDMDCSVLDAFRRTIGVFLVTDEIF